MRECDLRQDMHLLPYSHTRSKGPPNSQSDMMHSFVNQLTYLCALVRVVALAVFIRAAGLLLFSC